eukprot:1554304-Pyramimonas_sp.AAC.1
MHRACVKLQCDREMRSGSGCSPTRSAWLAPNCSPRWTRCCPGSFGARAPREAREDGAPRSLC